jgi:hypothetical protein
VGHSHSYTHLRERAETSQAAGMKRTAGWVQAGWPSGRDDRSHSFRATSGPVILSMSGKVEAISPMEPTTPTRTTTQ